MFGSGPLDLSASQAGRGGAGRRVTLSRGHVRRSRRRCRQTALRSITPPGASVGRTALWTAASQSSRHGDGVSAGVGAAAGRRRPLAGDRLGLPSHPPAGRPGAARCRTQDLPETRPETTQVSQLHGYVTGGVAWCRNLEHLSPATRGFFQSLRTCR